MASRREQILQNVQTSLQAITVAGGYNFDVARVSRKFIPYSKANEFPTLVVVAGPGRKEPETNTEYKEFFEIGVVGYIRAAKDIDNAGLVSQELEQLIQDITNALSVDLRRGNSSFVNMTWFRRVDPYVDWEANIGICEVIFEVEYFHTIGAA